MAQSTNEHCWNTLGVWGENIPRCEKLAEVIHCRNCEIYSNRGRDVFEKEIPEEYIVQWTKEYSLQNDEVNPPDISVIIFRIGNEWFSLPTYCFDEIAKILPTQKIPHYKGDLITGLTNVRGEIKLCFSLNHILEIQQGEQPRNNFINDSVMRRIVLTIAGDSFVFSVDEIVGVYRFQKSDLTALPDTLNRQASDISYGVIQLPNKNVTCLEPYKLRDLIEESISA